jgi:L-lactate dehydrogenase complex protein LldG
VTGKEIILSSIRRNRPEQTELPELNVGWTTFENPRAKFIEVLEAVGGQVILAQTAADLNEQLQRLPHFVTAQRVASLVPDIGTSNVEVAAADSPHALATIDVAILPGEFAVAENAAVWVTDRALRHRVLYFLCQHLVLVVPAGEVVDHMHAAYERLATPVFGVFISGPSKTADIEQQLVIGAHGPRSLTVCLLG